MTKLEQALGISETRNSNIRRKTAHLTTRLAEAADEYIPGITPTHVNILGALFVIGGSVAAIKGKQRLAFTLSTVGSLMDALDGPLARTKAKKDPNSVDFKKGQIYDALSDRTQELSGALGRAVRAHQKGDWLGETLAFATAVTSSWTSIARSYAEIQGKRVPESGKGLLGKVGTRVGKAVASIAATSVPEIKGMPVQPPIDALITVSNFKTTINRLEAIRNNEVTLSPETREEAKDRLKALGVFGILATGATLFTYWRLHRQEVQESPRELRGSNNFMQVIYDIEQYCQDNELDHRFVGGTLTDFIGPQTDYLIDPKRKKVTLINPKEPSLMRSDDTVKDVDLVIFTPDREKFERAKAVFEDWEVKAKEGGRFFPFISVEAARHPDWPKRNKLKQFVSAFEYDEEGKPHLVFGSTNRTINQDSLETWTVDTGNGVEITTFHPLGHVLCYALRVPSGVKRKDKTILGSKEAGCGNFNKMGLLGRFAVKTVEAGRETGLDGREPFKEWVDYIHTLSRNPDPLTRVKRWVTGLYWNTIGTKVAHGGGIFAKLSTGSNKLTG